MQPPEAQLKLLLLVPVKTTGSNVVRIEADALHALADRIDGPMARDFERAVECMHSLSGNWSLNRGAIGAEM